MASPILPSLSTVTSASGTSPPPSPGPTASVPKGGDAAHTPDTSYMSFMNTQDSHVTTSLTPGDVLTPTATTVWPPEHGTSSNHVSASAMASGAAASAVEPGPDTAQPKPPKRPINPFLHFSRLQRPAVKESNPNMPVSKIVPYLSAMWRGMSDEEKRPYVEMTEQDKQRYAKERAEFVAQSTSKPVFNRKHRRNKDNASDLTRVKRVAPAYIFFAGKHRRDIMKANPGMSNHDVSKLLGRMWKELPASARQEFDALHEQDKTRHAMEIQQRDNVLHTFQQLAMPVAPNVFVGDGTLCDPTHTRFSVAAAMTPVSVSQQPGLPSTHQYVFPTAPHTDGSHYQSPPPQLNVPHSL
eukprot:m.205690 g.205690  ORF g.205690 m.205690 type:complete len:354 (-) comp23040_c0_seq1:95-1156(-)